MRADKLTELLKNLKQTIDNKNLTCKVNLNIPEKPKHTTEILKHIKLWMEYSIMCINRVLLSIAWLLQSHYNDKMYFTVLFNNLEYVIQGKLSWSLLGKVLLNSIGIIPNLKWAEVFISNTL